MPRVRWRRSFAVMLVAGLACCASPAPEIDWSTPLVPLSPDLAAQVPETTPRDQAVRRGVQALARGDYPAASRQFNIALKLEPQNATLHFLNGLTYQLMVAKGDTQKAALAETAYLLALQFDPQHAPAAYQLGRLYLDRGDYPLAEDYLADAATGLRGNAEAYDALAVAAYYNRDLEMALWSSANAKRLAPSEPAILKASAVIATVAGRDDEAAADGRAYAASGVVAPRLIQFERRLAELRAERDETPARQLALLPGPVYDSPPPPAAGGSTAGTPEVPGAPAPPAVQAPSPVPAWFDCGGSSGAGGGGAASSSSSYGSGYTSQGSSPQGDEPIPIPALPSPCKDAAAPRMALIDVVIIRTEENESTSYGINLLQGLQTVLTGSISSTHTFGTTPTEARTNSFGLALGNTAAAGINYSLNIANAADSIDQIIARPTLLALDRQPSQFFSGANLSIALSGQYGGNVVEKPIGVSLSVTPTFIDDDTLLLSVKAARSFFEQQVQGSGTIGQSIETSRNMAVANVAMKFDQTLILSGLNEKQNTTTDTGVPFLRDIPGLQYLFSNRSTSNFAKSVLILLTPRRPAYGDQLPSPVDRLAARPSLKALRERAAAGIEPSSNVAVIAHSLNINQHYLSYRSGDVNAEYWIAPRSLERTLREALDLLYF